MAYMGDPTRYFTIHHTPADTVERIAPEEVAKAAAAISVVTYRGIADMRSGSRDSRLNHDDTKFSRHTKFLKVFRDLRFIRDLRG
jgi:hypothetical protein